MMNDATNLIANDAKSIVQAHLDRIGEPKAYSLSDAEKRENLKKFIKN